MASRIIPAVSLALVLVGIILICTGCGSDPTSAVNAKAPPNTGLVTRTVTVDGHEHKFAVFVPYEYTSDQKWPAIVFLHGIGEAGSDAHKNLTVGLGPIIEKRAATFPFVTVFPQSGGGWDGPAHEQLAIACLEAAEREFSIDPDRVILTGLSTGGFGTWHIGANQSSRFAALVPMAAHTAYDDVPKLTQTPIWCFHNSGDPLVWASGTYEMVKRINARGGQAKYTQFNTIGHNCWDDAYNDDSLINWMLNQRRTLGTRASANPIGEQ